MLRMRTRFRITCALIMNKTRLLKSGVSIIKSSSEKIVLLLLSCSYYALMIVLLLSLLTCYAPMPYRHPMLVLPWLLSWACQSDASDLLACCCGFSSQML